jgi:hypothetical protein
MRRKLMLGLSLTAAIAVTAGCKDDRPTSSSGPPKGAYEGQQSQYKQNVSGSTSTSPSKPSE